MIVYGPEAYQDNVIDASFDKRTLVYFSSQFQVSEYDEELCASAKAVYSLYNPFGPYRPRPAIALFENGVEIFYHPLEELKATAIAERVKALLPEWEFVPKPRKKKGETMPADSRYFSVPEQPGPPPYMAKLNKLVGMAGAKSEVVRLANTAIMAQKRKAAGLKPLSVSRHMVFRGNPGTGKTTFARIIAEVFKHHGLLSAGRCIEVDRSNLVGEYLGHSEKHTKAKLQEAIGSVLFIDEFYALTNTGISNDYGKQVIDLLVKFMEDHREDLVVIVAGYTDEMNTAIASNPGLKSRFSRYIDFPDYSAEELLEIFDRLLNEAGLQMTDNAFPAVWRAIKAHHACRGKDFGNARDMRTFFERLTEVQADRVVSQNLSGILTIEEADIAHAATLLRSN